MKAKFIYEKFAQNSDPIKDMDIGFKDELIYNDIRKMYISIRDVELKKLNTKIGNKIRKHLKEKLLGKVITGEFFDNVFKRIYTKVRVEKVEVKFGANERYSDRYQLKCIYVYGKKGKKYKLITDYKYKITG